MVTSQNSMGWKQLPGCSLGHSCLQGSQPLGLPSAHQCHQLQAWVQAGSQAHAQQQQPGLAQGRREAGV